MLPLDQNKPFDGALHLIARLHLFALLVLVPCVAVGEDPAAKPGAAVPSGVRVETTDGAYTNIGSGELHSLLAHKTFPLINVHVPYEGEIEGTDANVPYNKINKIVEILPSDKAAMIVLYCRSGRMSGETTKALVTLGYTNVWNLERGMLGWKEAGLPIVTKKLSR